MNKEAFVEYAELKIEIAELEAKCDALKPELLEQIPSDSKIDMEYGTFTLSSRKVWKYSDETTDLEDELKAKKKKEEQLGVAEATEGASFIVFKAKK